MVSACFHGQRNAGTPPAVTDNENTEPGDSASHLSSQYTLRIDDQTVELLRDVLARDQPRKLATPMRSQAARELMVRDRDQRKYCAC